MSELPPNTTEIADSDLSGRQLGDFRILRRLGRGAMAEVYLAEQGSLRRQVAIKVLQRHLASDETYVKRFHNEAQAAASLVHANIVQIHHVGSVEGVHYIAQEYVQGQNLQEFMIRHGPPNVRLALSIMRQVAAALHKASAAGIVHRDIKPENIMLARSGEVKVADFGLARLAANGDTVNLTQVGVTMGTPLYMSPEQVEGRPLDPRSDIYSFGVTCYQMLAGLPPFRGETALSVAVQHLKTQPERLESIRPDLPPALCRIVHTMLAKDPRKRYATTRDLLQDLRSVRVEGETGDWAAEVDEADGSLGDMLAAKHAATERLDVLMKTAGMLAVRRRRWRIALVAALLAAFLAGGALGWQRRQPFLLADAEQSVRNQGSAQVQLYLAKLQGDEEWLKSVEEYYPDASFEVTLANMELARLYLRQDRREEALQLFEQFAASPDSELRAFGLAGKSIVLTINRRYSEALQVLAELWSDRDKLDRDMRQMIRDSLLAIQAANLVRVSREEAEIRERWIEADPAPETDGG